MFPLPFNYPSGQRDGLVWWLREEWYSGDSVLMRHFGESGTEYWFNEKEELHRVNAPAVIYPDGKEEYW